MARAGKPLDPWQQDAVDLILGVDADGEWVCFEYVEMCTRQNGKGAILEARALIGFLLLGEALIMWSAHEYKTAMEAFRRMRTLIRRLGTVVNDNLVLVDGIYIKINNTHGDEGFERLDNEQRIRFVARSKDSGRGFTGDLNIIDETYAYTVDQQDALGPTMLATANPQFIYTSTPPLTAESGEVLYSLRERAEAMIESGVVDDALGYRDWGMDHDLDKFEEIDFDDPDNYRATNPALCTGRVTIKKIRKLRKMLGARGFARECFGLWPKRRQGGGAIDPKVWAAMLDPESKRDGDIALGVDIEPSRGYAAIGLYGTRADELGHVQILDYRAGTDWIVARLVELREVLDPVAIGMGRGTYKSLAIDLTEAGLTVPDDPAEPARGDLAVLDYVEMSAATSEMIDAITVKSFRHKGQTQLDESAAGVKIRETTDSVAWSRKGVDSSATPIVSVTEARYVLRLRLPLLPVGDYDPLANIW